ncbi:ATP-dependent nuclease subunit B [Streptococcus sp. sy010]|uniref:ATP-dependent nuclease subunit B n=1 Tax=Streptococcus sp. sy010 TaxID=2600148 RepID=UPI0011B662B6|nr:ATP-dependent nuclease subunit B [Streptococcus sp. sy010]TWT16468.1 ATP-dependent nuclease subunit B [Streptococcus sp. sy010]
MKLLYTDIWQELTPLLVEEAKTFAKAGKRVFYIAPNSLSFEKEGQVLRLLPERASFAITVTRFAQMARYLTLNNIKQEETIDDQGLTMIFYKLLQDFSDSDLQVYHRVRTDQAFIQQLVELYQEVKTSHLDWLDLEQLAEKEKATDLVKIFQAVDDFLVEHHLSQQSSLAFLSQEILAGRVDLSQFVIIIDGFTRFSAEEADLVRLLDANSHEVIVGVYASQKAYQAQYIDGHIYQASVTFLRGLASQYQTRPIYLTSSVQSQSGQLVTQALEMKTSFTVGSLPKLSANPDKLQIWQAAQSKDEIEAVAKSIRQLVQSDQGWRYRDITILVGDLTSYQLEIEKIFHQFDIPYYVAASQSMVDHPLVNFIEALERLKTYHYRAEDLLNLLKSGLYGQFDLADLDQFEVYLNYADVKGYRQFKQDFTAKGQVGYDLDFLNDLRTRIITPLANFLNSRPQKATSLLIKFNDFLNQVDVMDNMQRLSQGMSQEELEQQEQVWQTFGRLLEQVHTIFGSSKLTVSDFLSILSSGMQASHYRTLPATVDVVKVQSYDLVTPHHNHFIFALGMTQSVFPLIKQNKSLLSDEERLLLNQQQEDQIGLDVVSHENGPRNHYLALSLLNSARQQLVCSFSQSAASSDDLSSYLKFLEELGLEKQKLSGENDSSAYKAMLSRLLAVNHLEIETDDRETFWQQAIPFLHQKLTENELKTTLLDLPETVPVAAEVMQRWLPKDQLQLSVSALRTFYDNQYLYFLRYLLGLQEPESIYPDARQHGSYLHKVLEYFMADQSDQSFDQRFSQALAQTRQDRFLAPFYQQSAQGQFSRSILETIAVSVANFLEENKAIHVLKQEVPFHFNQGQQLQVRGIIDRLDSLFDGSQGIVDYKSSAKTFDLLDFYNGLDTQLVTYLQALKQTGQDPFGAMYLHLTEPHLKLKNIKKKEELIVKAYKNLAYKGLFLEDKKEFLDNGYYQLDLYSSKDIDRLLAYNQNLYQAAEQQIRTGHFKINPYTEDGLSVAGRQLKNITRFSSDQHMSYARPLLTVKERGEKRKSYLLGLMEGKDED